MARSVASLLALLSLLTVRPSLARPQDPRPALPRDSIVARQDSVARLPPVEVLASILPTGPAAGAGIAARSVIVPGAEFMRWQHRLLPEALAAAPGMSHYDDLGSSAKSTLVMRGFTVGPVVGLPQGISVFLDGVPLNEPDAGQINFDLLPLAHVRQVELLSGTASLLGPHSLGGAINLVTRRAPEAGRNEIELAAGSQGMRSVGISRAGGSPAGWAYYAGGGYSAESGWRQFTTSRQTNAFSNLGRSHAASGLNLQVFAAQSFAETAGSLPLSVYAVKSDSNLTPGDFEDMRQLHTAVSGYRALGSGIGSANVYFRHSDAERFNVNQELDPDVRSFSRNRGIGANGDWRTATPLAGGSISLRLGGGGSTSSSTVRIHAERVEPGLTTHVESPISKLDAYALADYVLQRVTLSGGLRLDAVRVPFRNRLNPARDTTSSFRRASPRIGVSVAAGPFTSLYVSAARSFRAPALIELACADPDEPCPLPFALGDDPPLDPVVASTYEAGARWSHDRAEASGAVYVTDVRNDIFLFPYQDDAEPAGSTIDGFFSNIEKTRRAGVELDFRAPLGRSLLYASYAYTRATFEVDGIEIFSAREQAGGDNDVEKGDRLPLVPTHTAALGASLGLRGGLSAGLQARYTGRRFLRGDEANVEEPLAGYWVADLRLGREFGGWSAGAAVRNALNRGYATFGTFNINQGAGGQLERFLTPGTPRTVRITVARRL